MTFIAAAVIGGVCVFLIPTLFVISYSHNDSVALLRQTILAATGSILAILTLWETRRKNDQEHMRQVHAERRSRYATAVEQLADDKASIRLGGVYTLVKLVDEWLADEKTISKEGERREEGQVIINSLCAYIRSPFGLASKTKVLSDPKTPKNYEGGAQQLVKDRASFREEKELRLTILSEIKKRLIGGTRIHKDGTQEILKGLWSDFNYDFSNTVFFYPVGFSNSYFGASSNFSGVKFTGIAHFPEEAFENKPIFEYTLDNKIYKARFSCKVASEDYNFKVSHDSPYKIETEEQEHNGVKFIIPKGIELFDPDEHSGQKFPNNI